MTQTITDILSAFGALIPAEIALEGSLQTDDSLCLAEERAHAEPMVASRADEFMTGRTCARRALRRVGQPDAALLPQANRAPAWPSGVVGSISHTRGICIAAVGHAQRYFGIGVDVERRLAVAPRLERYVATPSEVERFARVEDWRTIAFSAKESLFKCLNPPTGLWLEFREVELLSMERSSFQATVSPKDHEPFHIDGIYAFTAEYVLSAVVLPQGWSPA